MAEVNNNDITMDNLLSIVNQFINFSLGLIFRLFNYLFRNIVIVSILLIAGLALGFYLDYLGGKTYKNEIIVAPKFSSTDYLYESVDNYKFDIASVDPKFSSHIKNIEITAFEDIYGFTSQNNMNLETFKILAENGDLKKLLSDESTYRNYRYHKLTIYTDTSNNKEIVNAYLNHLNNNKYFKERQQVSFKNLQLKIEDYKQSINQINTILNKLGSSESTASSNSLNINTNSQVNEIINTKANLVDNLNWLETDLIEQQNIIYPVSKTLNIKVDNFILFRKFVIIPILLVGFFIILGFVKKLYTKYGK